MEEKMKRDAGIDLLEDDHVPTGEASEGGKKSEVVKLKPLNFVQIRLSIIGIRWLVQNAFANKARKQIQSRQEEGTQRTARRRQQSAKNFEEDARNAMHITADGRACHPCAAFRNAMIAAAATTYYKGVCKAAIFIIGDCVDQFGTDCVLIKGQDKARIDPTRVRSREGVATVDLHGRMGYPPPWFADVTIEFDRDRFDYADIVNLLGRAGYTIGIGEGRPGSPNSNGVDWGRFRVKLDDDKPISTETSAPSKRARRRKGSAK